MRSDVARQRARVSQNCPRQRRSTSIGVSAPKFSRNALANRGTRSNPDRPPGRQATGRSKCRVSFVDQSTPGSRDSGPNSTRRLALFSIPLLACVEHLEESGLGEQQENWSDRLEDDNAGQPRPTANRALRSAPLRDSVSSMIVAAPDMASEDRLDAHNELAVLLLTPSDGPVGSGTLETPFDRDRRVGSRNGVKRGARARFVIVRSFDVGRALCELDRPDDRSVRTLGEAGDSRSERIVLRRTN